MTTTTSLNKRVICEAYSKPKELRGSEKGGFAYIEQKQQLIGLKVLCDSDIYENGQLLATIKKNDIVYLPEDVLFRESTHRSAFCKDIFQDQPFLILNYSDIYLWKKQK